MAIDRPIIIVGTGRCGSTLLHRILSRHPDFGWLSTWNEVFPRRPWLAKFSNLYRSPRFAHHTKHRVWFPKPFEAYRYWENFLPGFSRRDLPQSAHDVEPEGVAPLRASIEEILRHQHKTRFLAKVTGWSRMAYFDRIFPDARFIALERDVRSVLSSWVQAGWLDVTSELDSPEWQWGKVPEAYRQAWEELGRGPLLSAAVKIQMDLDDIRLNTSFFPNRTHVASYEDLVEDPGGTLRAMTSFAGLAWSRTFEEHVWSLELYDARDKWKRFLSEEDAERVMAFFRQVGAEADHLQAA